MRSFTWPGGAAWQPLPSDFPPAMTVYDIFRCWPKAGVRQRVHDALRHLVGLRAGRNPLPTAVIIDSHTVRGADTVPTARAGYDRGKKTTGRKRRIAPDTPGLVLAVLVTAGHIQDRDGAHRLFAALCAAFPP